MGPAAVLLVALVADDGTVLRSAADDAAPAQAMLYRGDWLEVRGEAPGFLKVWDHRRERPGYVRPTALRLHRAGLLLAGLHRGGAEPWLRRLEGWCPRGRGSHRGPG